MRFTRFNIVILIGLVAIIGVIIMQLLLLNQAYQFEKKEIESKIHFALQDVVEKIYSDNGTLLMNSNPIEKITDSYYLVNINDVFENNILEHYLKLEFEKVKLQLDFEYAIYNCGSDKMVYGNYVAAKGNVAAKKCEDCFTKDTDLTYYFAIRFPEISKSYFSSLYQYWIFTFVLFFVLIIYVYSVFLMMQQKRYAELQKDFINNMTHEFKTPLSSILIASKYANTQKEIIANPKLSKYIQIIINQSNKLNQHIEKILYVAKSESKQIVLEKKQVNLNAIIELAKENILLKYQNKSKITNLCEPNLTLLADEFHFYNIIYNLMDNAVKYSEKNAELIVKTIEKNNQIELHFIDNGSGIPQEDLPFVFDKFFRVSRSNSKDIEGFGIGLAYVKRICNLHNWKIAIWNNTEKGITVAINISQKTKIKDEKKNFIC